MDSHVIDGNKSQQNFIDLGNHGLLKKYACGDKLDGQYGLSDSVEPILNFIFEIGNSSSTIDVFCTHDFQIMLFLLYIYGCEQSNQDQIWNSWPQMLEGLFLWGDKNHFWACWRGEIKEVIMKDF
ncbi:hypothetical protein [Methanimicrococcus blatticola]|nr:hypothetical protein [Methanimicrococcus blatticola]MBZ3935145.1 hypothetical protein [Methanimicrococcus blatticola]